MTRTVLSNLLILLLIIAALILIPFLIFSTQFDLWTADFLQRTEVKSLLTIVVIIALLAADVVLPVPSTILSTAAGYLFGFLSGTLISFVGMTLGILVGYQIGTSSRGAIPLLDEETKIWLSSYFDKYGIGTIAIARPIPVIAEASVIFAGMSKMKSAPFIIVSCLSNLGISIVYAGIGAYSMTTNSFLLAFLVSMAIPFIWAIVRLVRRPKS